MYVSRPGGCTSPDRVTEMEVLEEVMGVRWVALERFGLLDGAAGGSSLVQEFIEGLLDPLSGALLFLQQLDESFVVYCEIESAGGVGVRWSKGSWLGFRRRLL